MDESFKHHDAFEILSNSMPPELLKEALKVVHNAIDTCTIEKDIASKVKRKMDELDGGAWHCIVGKDFGCSLCFETKHLLFAKYVKDKRTVLLFKSFDVDRHLNEYKE